MYLLALIGHTLSEKEVKMSGKYCFAGAAEIRSLSKLKISFNVDSRMREKSYLVLDLRL